MLLVFLLFFLLKKKIWLGLKTIRRVNLCLAKHLNPKQRRKEIDMLASMESRYITGPKRLNDLQIVKDSTIQRALNLIMGKEFLLR